MREPGERVTGVLMPNDADVVEGKLDMVQGQGQPSRFVVFPSQDGMDSLRRSRVEITRHGSGACTIEGVRSAERSR